MLADVMESYSQYRRFLEGGAEERPFVCLDPSSFASVYAGKDSGYPTLEDQLTFRRDFPSDAGISIPYDLGEVIPALRWRRRELRTEADGTVYWEETLETPYGTWQRVTADRFGTIPWLVEPAMRSEADFSLADYYAQQIEDNAAALAGSISHVPDLLRAEGVQPGATIFSAFELQYLIDYADMPVFFMDWSERYLRSVAKMHRANTALLEAMSGIGVEMFYTGSAGVELLSPTIFEQAIVPFQREFNDRARDLGCFVIYHVCGHSRQLIEHKIIDKIRPTVFETCSEPPCGNNTSLRDAVDGIGDGIITKGNLSLELLFGGSPADVVKATERILAETRGGRHIIGQADATILPGTPHENLRAFIEAARG